MNEGNGKIERRVAQIPRPERDMFEGETKNVSEHLMKQPQPVFVFERAEYPESGGTYVYLRDVKYPTKGFPTPEACQAANIVKRMYVGQLRFLAKNFIASATLLRKKNLERWLRELNSAADIALAQFYLKPIRYNRACRQIRIFMQTFMESLKITQDLCQSTAKIIATLLEYDNAYLLRLQDLANETTAVKLHEDFRGELLRLLMILKQRDERPKIHEIFGGGVKLLTFIWYIPRIKIAIRKALLAIDFSEIQMDEGDRYHALRWLGYDSFGIPFEERTKKFLEIHNGIPPRAYIMQTQMSGINLHE